MSVSLVRETWTGGDCEEPWSGSQSWIQHGWRQPIEKWKAEIIFVEYQSMPGISYTILPTINIITQVLLHKNNCLPQLSIVNNKCIFITLLQYHKLIIFCLKSSATRLRFPSDICNCYSSVAKLILILLPSLSSMKK